MPSCGYCKDLGPLSNNDDLQRSDCGGTINSSRVVIFRLRAERCAIAKLHDYAKTLPAFMAAPSKLYDAHSFSLGSTALVMLDRGLTTRSRSRELLP